MKAILRPSTAAQIAARPMPLPIGPNDGERYAMMLAAITMNTSEITPNPIR